MPGAGDLDRKITILREAVGRDPMNNEVAIWPPFLTKISAMWRPATAREQLANQEIGAEVEDIFEIRWFRDAATITPKDRVLFGEREYDIAAVREVNRRYRIRILAAARADTTSPLP